MNDLLTEAKLIIANNKNENAARDLMSNEQRAAIAENYANQKQFSSAAYFTPDADKKIEFERLFVEYMLPKIIK
jgi:hypothetical protein